MVVQGPGPGPLYGHAMDLVAERYLVTVSGNDGEYMFTCCMCFSSFFPTCFRALSILMNGIGKNYDAWIYV